MSRVCIESCTQHTHIYVYIYIYTYVRVCALDTQGRYMGLRPLYAGMINGSGPFIPRDAGRGLSIYIWVWALYTQGCWPGIKYIFGSVPRYTGIWPGIIYIHTYNTKHMYMCVHMSCLSHARVVPILDAPTVPRVRDQ